MKKVVSLLLSIVLIIAMVPLSAITASAETYSGTCGDNITWEFDNTTGTLTISGKGAMTDYTSSNRAPWYIYRHVIKSVTLSDEITSIGNYAFYLCYVLTEVTITKNITSIGNYAFYMCTALKTVYNYSSLAITEGNTSYGNAGYYADNVYWYYPLSGTCAGNLTYIFDETTGVLTISGIGEMINFEDYYYNAPWYNYRSLIKEVVISEGVTSIGNYAFYGCDSLAKITIPNSVTSIGSRAFCDCASLTEITLPNNITSIGDDAFAYCTNLKTVYNYSKLAITEGDSLYGYVGYYADDVYWYYAENGICGENLTYSFDGFTGALVISGTGTMTDYNSSNRAPWYIYRHKIKSVTLSDGITSIGSNAFYRCSGLTEVTIPNNVTSIGDTAFYMCSGLTEVTIPNSVTGIGDDAFENCSLKTIYNYSRLTITEYAENVYWYYPLSGSCGENLTFVFDDTAGILTISGIGEMTNYNSDNYNSAPWYRYRTHIKEIVISNSITSIGNDAFYRCSNLTEIIIPNSIKRIGTGAFEFCSKLKTVYNYSNLGVTEGGTSYGYLGCYADDVFWYDIGEITETSSWRFDKNTGILEIIGSGETPNYNLFTSTPWYSIADQIKAVEIDEGITKIGTYSFHGLNNLKEVSTTNKNLQFGTYALNPSIDFKMYSLSGGALENYCLSNGIDFEVPLAAPELYSVTANSITVKAISGYEYSKDGTTWQKSNTFTGLDAVTEYSVYVRRKGMLTKMALAISPALKTKTIKKTADTPVNPVVIDTDGTTVTLQAVSGYEYSIDGVTWQSSNMFTDLEANKVYEFYQRIKETDDTFASESSKATKAIVVTSPSVTLVGATTLEVEAIDGYEYSLDKITWQSSPKFTNLIYGLEYTVYQRPTATDVYYEEAAGTTVTLNGKDRADTPSAPTLSGKTDTTVTLTAKSGYEYKMDNGAWQSSNVFEGLEYDTTYTFYCRIAETDTTFASKTSVALEVTTDKAYVLADLNNDGSIDTGDLSLIKNNLAGVAGVEINPLAADLNSDGIIDTTDLAELKLMLAGATE